MAKAPALKKKANQLPTISDDVLESMSGMGTGLENVTGADLIIPRMGILQALSPQVKQGKPEFDEDARVGQIYDIGLRESFGDELHFLPVHFFKQWLEWAPRSTGKGLITIHTSTATFDEYERNEKGIPVSPEGNTIQETYQFYGLNLDAMNRRTFIPFASTQIKKARRLLTLATGEKVKLKDGSEQTPPLFFRSYKLGTVPESNVEGDWIGWTVERDAPLNELPEWGNILEEVKIFREQVSSGSVQGDVSDLQNEAASAQKSNEGDI